MTDFVAELQLLANDAAELAQCNRRLPAEQRATWGKALLEDSLDLHRQAQRGDWHAPRLRRD